MRGRRPIGYNSVAHFKIVRGADGLRYIHDPDFKYWWIEHVHIPQPGDAVDGLGAVPGYAQAGAAALNFVPGIGPILSTVASLALSIFGSGGDPTPRGQIWSTIISLRQQIADMRNQLAAAGAGAPDDFTFSGDPNADRQGGDEAAWITSEVLQLHPGTAEGVGLSSQISRADEYNAIKALQQLAAQLQSQLQQTQQSQHDAALIAAVRQASAPAPTSSPASTSSSAPIATAPASTSSSTAPAIAGFDGPILAAVGVAAAIVLIMSARSGDGRR
jgi:hypothetical protein